MDSWEAVKKKVIKSFVLNLVYLRKICDFVEFITITYTIPAAL